MDARHALEVLIELTRQLTERQSLDEALHCITDAALALLPARHASIRILDRDGSSLLSGARSGAGESVPPAPFERGVGLAGWVVEAGRSARVEDVRKDDRFVALGDQGHTIRSILAVPLWSGGAVVGVLALSSDEVGHFSEDDEALASLLANCAVPPLERARLARLAMTDAQTKAFNHGFLRAGLQAEMDKLRGGSRPLSLLLLDLDRFKEVNDRYGHATGDRVLEAFADRIRAVTRTVDLLVRRGGDEFVLIMPGAGPETAQAVARRIQQDLATKAFFADGPAPVAVRVSVGVAIWDGDESPEHLEARADEAMYRAKRAGRNGVCVA
ncbi:MAG: sensor domain-containing diguanylate cyclase [Myxococcota bacterium]